MANQVKREAKKQARAIKTQTKLDKNNLKQQSRVDKAQLQQDAQKQQYELDQQRSRQNLESAPIRQEAVGASRYIPYNARDRATATHSTEDQPIAIRNTDADQDAILKNLYGILPQGIQGLNMPGGQSNFAPIANEARRNFSQNTIPTLAERFAGLGRNSSGLQQTLGGAGAQFESQLAALQAEHGLQEQSLQSSNLFNSLGAFLDPRQDTSILPGEDSDLRTGWNTVKKLGGDALKGYFAGGGNLSGIPQGLLQTLGLGGGGQSPSNGSGTGSNSVGFGGVQKAQGSWQPTPTPSLSVNKLASAGYPQLNDVFNQRQFKF